MRKINQDGIDLVKHYEGCKLKTYVDVAGNRTIGYGHMSPKLGVSDTITQEQADELLSQDLIAAECAVLSVAKVPLNDNQFSALVCFVFNVGASNLKASTLLKLINSKEYVVASKEFVKWNHAGGKVFDGLTKRRASEAALFIKQD